MEETWELAAVSEPVIEWSGRHTRLRYQSVLTSLIFLMATFFGIKDLKIPGVLTFLDTPSNNQILIGVFVFSVFSIFSFLVQHRLEGRRSPSKIRVLSQHIKDIDNALFKGSTLFQGIETFAHNFHSECENPIMVSDGVIFLKKSDWKDYAELQYLVTELKDKILLITNAKTDFNDFFSSKNSKFNRFNQRFNLLYDVVMSLKVDSRSETTNNDGTKLLGFRDGDIDDYKSALSKYPWRTVETQESFRKLKADVMLFSIERWLHVYFLPFWVPLTTACIFLILGIKTVLVPS